MTAKNLFTFVAFISVLFGAGLAFATPYMAQLYLTNPGWLNPASTLMAQGWGALLIATAAGCWYVRTDGPSVGRNAMLVLLVITNLGWTVMHLVALLGGVETPMAWLQVGMTAVVGSWATMLLRQPTGVVA